MIKKVWFSDLKLVDVHRKTNTEQGNKTISDTLIIDIEEKSNQNEPPTSENKTPHN